MLQQFTTWLAQLITAAFTALWDFVADAAISIVDLALTALATLVAGIPIPDFLSGGMQALFGGIGSDISYILNACGFQPAVALYGAGWAFRLARKFLTLFQW